MYSNYIIALIISIYVVLRSSQSLEDECISTLFSPLPEAVLQMKPMENSEFLHLISEDYQMAIIRSTWSTSLPPKKKTT